MDAHIALVTVIVIVVAGSVDGESTVHCHELAGPTVAKADDTLDTFMCDFRKEFKNGIWGFSEKLHKETQTRWPRTK